MTSCATFDHVDNEDVTSLETDMSAFIEEVETKEATISKLKTDVKDIKESIIERNDKIT